MSLNEVASSERVHISFFGRRNAGKSSLVNAVTGQKLSIVSDIPGTTTDSVKKTMELLPLGPVCIIDTPGIDDVGALGELRVNAARRILALTDIAVIVVDSLRGLADADRELLSLFDERVIPHIVAFNKSDLLEDVPSQNGNTIYVSAITGYNIDRLKEMIASSIPPEDRPKRLVGDLLSPGDSVLLVVPIDKAAPKGRLILPQQQVMRDILDSGCYFSAFRDTELEYVLSKAERTPSLVITDSQVFGKVSKVIPENVRLTSFSILFARYKGELDVLLSGADALKLLSDNDRVLISEGCTHHRQCGDIGTQKLPAWIREYSGKDLDFSFTSGGDFPDDLSKYKLVVHCGGCMLNEREMKSRINRCIEQKVPIVNYGIAIAKMNGILDRSVEPFKI